MLQSSRRPAFYVALVALVLVGCNATPSSAPAADSRSVPSAAQPGTSGSSSDQSPNESRRSRSRHAHGSASAQPGDFDFYLLNLSWSPEFCATHSSSPECASHLGFVVHGLWPQNTDGSYPENCSNAPGPADPSQYTDLQPSVGLVEHEWTTHGTCSGLAADAYFVAIRRVFQSVRIPTAFASGEPPAMLSPDAILTQFSAANPTFPAPSFALSCGNNYLTAIEACFDKNLHPEACAGVRSCRANAVKITPR
jgi:ribonuclease T2